MSKAHVCVHLTAIKLDFVSLECFSVLFLTQRVLLMSTKLEGDLCVRIHVSHLSQPLMSCFPLPFHTP